MILQAMATIPRDGRFVLVFHRDFSGTMFLKWDETGWTVPELCYREPDDLDYAGWVEIPEPIQSKIQAFHKSRLSDDPNDYVRFCASLGCAVIGQTEGNA
jgi:hypothetical protein